MTTAIAQLQPGQPGYPERLRTLGWRRTLRVRGQLPTGAAVAIVGARAASVRGMERAHAIARHFAERGVHVVSGGALGIDGAAHRGALAGHGTTSVVLGSGVDVFYPERHAKLFEEVLACGGAVISQLPDGTTPDRTTFVQRNPLIAALADVVFVIEADLRSGSMSTAAAAKKLGRIVAAWPNSRGCEDLISQGAAVIESIEDAEAALAGTPRAREISMDPIAAQIRAAIASGARGVDGIVAHTGLSVRAVVRALSARLL